MNIDTPSGRHERILVLDILRGLAILLMIFAHVVYFTYSGQNLFIDVLARSANTIVFTLFLFLSGAASFIAYERHGDSHASRKIHILRRVATIYCGYLIIAAVMIAADRNRTSLSSLVQPFINAATLRMVPSFSEFLIPLFLFALLIIPLGGLFRKISENIVTTLLVGAASFLLVPILYPLVFTSPINEWKALFVGAEGILRFPIFSYLPVFLLGFWWGRLLLSPATAYSKTLRAAYGAGMVTLGCIILSLIAPSPYLEVINRWPPSLGFLSLGLFVSFITAVGLLHLMSHRSWEQVFRFLCLLGQDAYDIFLVHLILLALWQRFFGFHTGRILLVLLFYVLITITATILSSLHWSQRNFSLSTFRISLSHAHRYRIRKRYLLPLLVLLFAELLDLHKSQRATTFGGVIPAVPPVFQVTLTENRNWFLSTAQFEKNPIVLTAQSSASVPNDIPVSLILTGSQDTYSYPMNRINATTYSWTSPASQFPPDTYTAFVKVNTRTPHESRPMQFHISAPLLLSWTLDWEGWDVPNETLANIERITKLNGGIPVTHFVSPRTFFPSVVGGQRAHELATWFQGRVKNQHDEIGLHLHMQFDLVAAAGVSPRKSPAWGYMSSEGYDVLTTVYSPEELHRLISWGANALEQAGFQRPQGYRAGGWFANANVLRAVADTGLLYDASGRERPLTGAFHTIPWTLASTTQPYIPSQRNQNLPVQGNGEKSFPLLEIPNNGGTSFELTEKELYQKFLDNYTQLILSSPKEVTYLSHPQFAANEFPRIEPVLRNLQIYSYREDQGPVIFVTQKTLFDLWHTP